MPINDVLALARAGSTSRAWDAFIVAGMESVTADPQVLTLKGRLFKDQARKARGEVAARLYLQSAKAYADAAALRPDSYPLINAATMSLFAGQSDHMALLAERVLTMLDTGTGVGETPYWHEATRAEALLLLVRQAEAKAALDTAIAAAPAAWEDRAVTLRQFRQVLEFRNEPSKWLSDYSPPTSVYFKGMIGISPEDRRAAEAARDALESKRAGFGYGALAAGADILVAEALIERGAELHLILPMAISAFRQRSVDPFGAAWVARFDMLLAQAASVSIISPSEILSEASIDLAAQVAKGTAIENALRLEGSAAGIELNDTRSHSFDAASDLLVQLERSAHVASADTESGRTSVTLVCDQIVDDCGNWTPAADGFYVCDVRSLAEAQTILREIQIGTTNARTALQVVANAIDNDDGGDAITLVLRIAKCALPGTITADAASARALLSLFPNLWTEPLGELSDASGPIEIYAISPKA